MPALLVVPCDYIIILLMHTMKLMRVWCARLKSAYSELTISAITKKIAVRPRTRVHSLAWRLSYASVHFFARDVFGGQRSRTAAVTNYALNWRFGCKRALRIRKYIYAACIFLTICNAVASLKLILWLHHLSNARSKQIAISHIVQLVLHRSRSRRR